LAIAYLGIGSNLKSKLGNSQTNIVLALSMLEDHGIKIRKCSKIIETDPIGVINQNKFQNGVVEVETELLPIELLKKLKLIEKTLGRIKTVVNGPRTIDLDILLYDDIQVQSKELTIPHPRMFERDFVLKPLMEIAPEIMGISNAHH